jgi:hypothetical protein
MMQMRCPVQLLSTLLLAVLLILTGCSTFGNKEDDPSPLRIDFSRFSQDEAQLVGRWEWKQSVVYGSADPSVSTPTRTGRTETLVFSSPPDTVHVYRDDTLARRSTLKAFLENTKWGVRGDTLVTSTAFRDGPQKIYERVEQHAARGPTGRVN